MRNRRTRKPAEKMFCTLGPRECNRSQADQPYSREYNYCARERVHKFHESLQNARPHVLHRIAPQKFNCAYGSHLPIFVVPPVRQRLICEGI
ncbi:MAG: hypothetical protein ABL999_00860 [Pyrinomonadaceae bacterium]